LIASNSMSVVGPRPEVEHYVNMFTEEEKAIFSVRPGITAFDTLWNPYSQEVLILKRPTWKKSVSQN
jgi:lipopolysaccharide/colanic/teichoic acid biosynthesis glycosyltransferase